jgi:hypothetical protein
MDIVQRIPGMTEAELKQLGLNATAALSGARREESERVLAAISAERDRRRDVLRIAAEAKRSGIREAMAGLTLKDRVVAAFRASPPIAWEVDVIQALDRNPGASTDELSMAVGYSGAYMNWFGHVARDREAWLGSAEAGPGGKIVYSSLLVDFVPMERDGRKTTGWHLKPQARDGLLEVGVLQAR